MLKIFIINPTYQYVYECIVKIVYHSYEDGNKKFNQTRIYSWSIAKELAILSWHENA
jgi:hypothetical protein